MVFEQLEQTQELIPLMKGYPEYASEKVNYGKVILNDLYWEDIIIETTLIF